MTRSPLFAALATAGALFLASTGLADDGLIGTWTAVEDDSAGGMRSGTPSENDHDDGGDDYLGYVPAGGGFTITIDETEGRAFSGQACSPAACEDLSGTVSNSGTIYMVDTDGIVIAERDGDAMEVCYLEPGEDFRVVICGMFVKNE